MVARLKRGTALRITDIEGGANAGALFYNFECPVERYNMPDTLKAQHIARLTAGLRALFRHGPHPLLDHRATRWAGTTRIGGCSNAALVRAKYGEARYQECRNDCHKNALRQLPGRARQVGTGPARPGRRMSISSAASTVGEDGGMQFQPGNSQRRRLRRTARRDERARRSSTPASIRSIPIRTTRPSRCSSRFAACRRPGPTIPAASRGPKTGAASP